MRTYIHDVITRYASGLSRRTSNKSLYYGHCSTAEIIQNHNGSEIRCNSEMVCFVRSRLMRRCRTVRTQRVSYNKKKKKKPIITMMSIDVQKETGEKKKYCFIRIIIIIITFMIMGRNRVVLVTFFDRIRLFLFFYARRNITITATIIYSENALSRVFSPPSP